MTAMTYRAKTALPYQDQVRAVSGLRGHLRKVAGDDGATVDWSTLRIDGPHEVVGANAVVWYEWTAIVDEQQEPARYL